MCEGVYITCQQCDRGCKQHGTFYPELCPEREEFKGVRYNG